MSKKYEIKNAVTTLLFIIIYITRIVFLKEVYVVDFYI